MGDRKEDMCAETQRDQAEIVKAVMAVEAEQARRTVEPLKLYNRDRVHQKQIMFHKCEARERWVFGGNRSGKTECGAAEAVWRLLGTHPYCDNRADVSGWAVSLSTQVQRDVAQAKILKYLPKRAIASVVMVSGSKSAPEGGVIDYILIKNAFGGLSRLGFKSCDQGREKFQGASLDFVWFDEEPPEDVYTECRMRVMDRRGVMFGTMTPLKGLTWVYDRVFCNPDVWHVSMEWADNPYLDPAEIDAMTVAMGADELRTRRYGQFAAKGGMVYPEFTPSVHVIEPFAVPKEWYSSISIDPGLHNPLSAHWYAVDYDGTVYVVAEHYEAGKDVGYHADRIKEISAALTWHADWNGRYAALIDSAASQRTLAASKSVTELFFEQGIAVNPRVDKDLFGGIARVKSYLVGTHGKPKLYIFSTCHNLIREMKGYFWGKGDVPIKKDDHALDELRYFLATRPKLNEPPRVLTEIEKDKRRLMRTVGRRSKGSAQFGKK